jgi:AraC-like DNA-binding protein
MVVGDPSYEGGRCADAMRAIRRQFPSVMLFAYISLTPDSVLHMIRAAASGITDCLVYRHDDSPQRFSQLMAQVRDTPLILAMLDALKPELDRLTEPWRDAVGDMYRRPTRYLATSDLAAAVDTTRQTLHRRLRLAGLRSPRLLVASGRVLRATQLLRDPSRTILLTAKQLGYHRPEHLTATVKLLTGIQTRDLRRGVDAGRITSAIAQRLTSADRDLPVICACGREPATHLVDPAPHDQEHWPARGKEQQRIDAISGVSGNRAHEECN